MAMLGRFKRGARNTEREKCDPERAPATRSASRNTFAAFLLSAVALFLSSGCATEKAEDPNRVSTTPWNRPESWEGQGILGGFNTDTR